MKKDKEEKEIHLTVIDLFNWVWSIRRN